MQSGANDRRVGEVQANAVFSGVIPHEESWCTDLGQGLVEGGILCGAC